MMYPALRDINQARMDVFRDRPLDSSADWLHLLDYYEVICIQHVQQLIIHIGTCLGLFPAV